MNNYEESKKRLKRLQNILEHYQLKNNQANLNKYCEVLVENKLKEGEKYFGRTKFMTPVKFESNTCRPGDLVNVKITSFNHSGLFGVSESRKVEAA